MKAPDWFTRSRRAIQARRQYLSERSAIDNPAALIVLSRRGVPIDNISDARDARLIELIDLLEANEKGAAHELHGYLSDCLRENCLTDLMRELLADMHNALSRGVATDRSMLVNPPRGRHKNTRRDDAIRRYVLSRLTLRQIGVPGFSPREVWREAARIFSVTQKTVKNICAKRPEK
jgi:hypothetical protein